MTSTAVVSDSPTTNSPSQIRSLEVADLVSQKEKEVEEIYRVAKAMKCAEEKLGQGLVQRWQDVYQAI